jgi:peptidoglycan-N-acetylmuramic acid deacetylase
MTKRWNGTAAATVGLTLILTHTVLWCPAVSATDSSAIGYGQGTTVDEENRPCDALTFDAQYGQYDAYATTPDRSRILLTFDQGYENGYTAQILDTLQEKGVQAIFFLTGDYAKSEPELVRRMIAEGHVLGNHGMTHASLPEMTEQEAEQEILDLHQYVEDTYGYTMQYFRFPCGTYSPERLQTVQSLGYRTLFWSYAYVDWQVDDQPDPAQALEQLTNHAHGGEILLLHAVSETNAEILGDAIDAFRSAGFTV